MSISPFKLITYKGISVAFDLKFKDITDGVSDSVSSIANETTILANRVVDNHICIGVTGFSGSGKSTFITSLIHQLRYSNEATLGGFLPARDQKIVNVELLPLNGLELFDYQHGIESLASSPPKWPRPTSTLSGCIVEITYKRDSLFSGIIGKTTKLKIEIRDYPGEWLLDIPLLEQDYLSWCRESADILNQPQRKALMGSLFSDLQSISPFDKLSDHDLDNLCQRYSDFLKVSKLHGLTLIQPGHMLLPSSSDSFDQFFPLLGLQHYDKKALEDADHESVYKVMKSRYITYLNDIVKPFHHDFFKSIDRQVILIDSLKALSGGKDNFEDMMIAFSRIIDSYRVGSSNFVSKLFSPKVERIIFLSSKPDRVLMNQHENLRYLTNNIINRVCRQSIRNTIQIETEIACSVRCTEDNNSYMTAVLSNGQKGQLAHPEIPEKIPTDEQWAQFENWKPHELQPPIISNLQHGGRLPSIRMDKVLKDLIGDKFS